MNQQRTMYQRITGDDGEKDNYYELIEGDHYDQKYYRVTPLPNNYNTHFKGICYLCKVPNHSQKYCPLRFCKRCCTFGHSSDVCLLTIRGPTKSNPRRRF